MTTYNGHIIFETGDELAPRELKDRNGEVVLAMCSVCGRGEIELVQPCHNPQEPK